MTEAQIRRYARHILLPDVGGIGQAQLLAATARIDGDDAASAIAAHYLAAGGVGTLAIASPTLRTELADRNPDCQVTASDDGPERNPESVDDHGAIAIPVRPSWFPLADEAALAWWAGGLAATRWLARAVQR